MKKAENVFSYIDHTKLGVTTTWEEVQMLCEEAILYKTASVCIPPSYISKVKKLYGGDLQICTVIGFPLGYSTTETKVFEAQDAIGKGADEIDMVINLTDVKNNLFEQITYEIQQVKEAIGSHVLKVIIETCELTEAEKRKLCHVVKEGKADYIKTSTGFASGGATKEDIELFQDEIGDTLKIKAAGGIHTLDDLDLFIHMGCSRIGTSKAVKLLTRQETSGNSY